MNVSAITWSAPTAVAPGRLAERHGAWRTYDYENLLAGWRSGELRLCLRVALTYHSLASVAIDEDIPSRKILQEVSYSVAGLFATKERFSLLECFSTLKR